MANTTGPPRVLISGAGIAAGVFASWLLRAYPEVQITIVEREHQIRTTGAGVDIRSSAVDIVKWMDLEATIRAQTTTEQGVQFVNADDTPIATSKASGDPDKQSMTSELEILRGTLATILFQPILDRVEILYGESIKGYTQDEHGVTVTFKRSKEVKTYDMLVAADGVGSRIRGMMLDAEPREQIDNEGSHIAYFTMDRDLLLGSNLAKCYSTTGGRAVFIRPDPDPSGRSRCHFVNTSTRTDMAAKGRFDEALKQGDEAYKQLVDESFRDAGWLAPEVLEGMHSASDFYCSTFAQVHSPKLVDGRVVLIGDAGYATRGLGTSLAIIGAYVLAGEFLNNNGDGKAAAQKYENLMLPFVKKSQTKLPGSMQLLNPQTSGGLMVRNTIMRLVAGLGIDKIAMTMGQYLGFAEAKLSMPDYHWPAK